MNGSGDLVFLGTVRKAGRGWERTRVFVYAEVQEAMRQQVTKQGLLCTSESSGVGRRRAKGQENWATTAREGLRWGLWHLLCTLGRHGRPGAGHWELGRSHPRGGPR